MLIRVFPRGKGAGLGPVEYTCALNPFGRGKREYAPKVLKGDPNQMRMQIDAVPFNWKYSSGVWAFAPTDNPTKEQLAEFISDFEDLAFAGLPHSSRSDLIVQHYTGRYEIHFIIPRQEVHSGKSFNPFPPGWEKKYNLLVDKYNYKYGWARPDDPRRARPVQPGHEALIVANALRKKETPPKLFKKMFTDHFIAQIYAGKIKTRNDMITALQKHEFSLPRIGKDYITVMTKNGTRIRLKGNLYAEDFEAEKWIKHQEAKANIIDEPDLEKAAEADKALQEAIRKTAEYNIKRYQPAQTPLITMENHKENTYAKLNLRATSSEPRKSKPNTLSANPDHRQESLTTGGGHESISRMPPATALNASESGGAYLTEHDKCVQGSGRNERDYAEGTRRGNKTLRGHDEPNFTSPQLLQNGYSDDRKENEQVIRAQTGLLKDRQQIIEQFNSLKIADADVKLPDLKGILADIKNIAEGLAGNVTLTAIGKVLARKQVAQAKRHAWDMELDKLKLEPLLSSNLSQMTSEVREIAEGIALNHTIFAIDMIFKVMEPFNSLKSILETVKSLEDKRVLHGLKGVLDVDSTQQSILYMREVLAYMQKTDRLTKDSSNSLTKRSNILTTLNNLGVVSLNDFAYANLFVKPAILTQANDIETTNLGESYDFMNGF